MVHKLPVTCSVTFLQAAIWLFNIDNNNNNEKKNSCYFQNKKQVPLAVHSQEYSLNIHPSYFNKPSSEAETACISKVDHGLGEGES